jgi:3-oxoacyl-[acyl-carrier protein] reductase/2-[hydroxy(phenyl)methyl]-succinyl-CoA dehydrogenase BbsC subunit
MMDMKDRVVLVAGAVNDVGEAVSLRLAQGGATIVLADSDKQGLTALEKKVADAGGTVKAVVVNLANGDEVEAAVTSIAEESGSIDVLVNCMDTPGKASVSDTALDGWQSLVDSNLSAMFYVTKAVVSTMRAKQYGRIVNINDLDYLGMAGSSGYSTVKSGAFGLTRGLALELAKEGITVNTVVKGVIQKPDVTLSEEEYANAAKRMPVNKLGTTDDIAYAVSLFASESSNYMTGQTLFVCGGKSLFASMSV